MARNRKYEYSKLMDNKVSFYLYQRSNENDNSKKVKDKFKILKKVIEKELTLKQKEIFNMYYLNRDSIKQISQKLGKDKSTVSRSLKRSREKIKKYMQYNAFR